MERRSLLGIGVGHSLIEIANSRSLVDVDRGLEAASARGGHQSSRLGREAGALEQNVFVEVLCLRAEW